MYKPFFLSTPLIEFTPIILINSQKCSGTELSEKGRVSVGCRGISHVCRHVSASFSFISSFSRIRFPLCGYGSTICVVDIIHPRHVTNRAFLSLAPYLDDALQLERGRMSSVETCCNVLTPGMCRLMAHCATARFLSSACVVFHTSHPCDGMVG